MTTGVVPAHWIWSGNNFARITQERLQVIAEQVLPESQCGLRKGRGCCDMVFVARQLMEKARKYNDSLFTLLIDLQTAKLIEIVATSS